MQRHCIQLNACLQVLEWEVSIPFHEQSTSSCSILHHAVCQPDRARACEQSGGYSSSHCKQSSVEARRIYSNGSQGERESKAETGFCTCGSCPCRRSSAAQPGSEHEEQHQAALESLCMLLLQPYCQPKASLWPALLQQTRCAGPS